MNQSLHFLRFLAKLDPPFSQVTDDEISVLLTHSLDKKTIVELGCYEGKTTTMLAKHTSGHVFSVDPFIPGRLGVSYGEWIAKVHTRRSKVKNVTLIKGYSYDVVSHFNRHIDFLFIDADHSLDGVRRDWNDWFPIVSRGGIIAMHDCLIALNSTSILGSMIFYRDFLQDCKEIQQIGNIDSLVIFRKI